MAAEKSMQEERRDADATALILLPDVDAGEEKSMQEERRDADATAIILLPDVDAGEEKSMQEERRDADATTDLILLPDVDAREEKSMQEERRDADATALILLPEVDTTALIHLAEVAGELEGEKDEKVYPPPLHSHEEVVSDSQLFMESLRQFHSTMNTKFKSPVLGGETLDLHLLYMEVTRRGGLEKVTAEKTWRDVVAAFEFPPSATSASFVMRKYYLSLLYHYEQVHFFHARGPLIQPSDCVLLQKKLHPRKLNHSLSRDSGSNMRKGKKKKRALPDHHQNEDSDGLPAVGSIDAEFDYGYMIKMKMGDENLCGMLYRVNFVEGATNSFTLDTTAASALSPPVIAAPEMSSSDGGGSSSQNTVVGQINRQKKPRVEQANVPTHPKYNRSAYNFFFVEKQAMFRAMYPGKRCEFCKRIGEAWKKLTPEERMVYESRALEDKNRYMKEIQEYNSTRES